MSDDDQPLAERALGQVHRVRRMLGTVADRVTGVDAVVGQTPRTAVWTRGRSTLWRYGGPDHEPEVATPVLLVHSLVSKSFILDLQPGNSMVEQLLARGLAVYLLEFGVPDARDAANTLATYVDGHIPPAAAAAREDAGSDELLWLGYCMGGTLAQLAVGTEDREERDLGVRAFATMATPIDWPRMGLLTQLFDDGMAVSDVLDVTGNMPPEQIVRIFRTLQPTNELSSWAAWLSKLDDERWQAGYDAMSKWINEQIPFPGAALQDTADLLVRGNGLMTGGVDIGGRRRSLDAIEVPTLVVAAQQDFIVPRDAALPPKVDVAGGEVYGGEVTVLEPDAGHVGMVAGRQAATETLPAIMDWLVEHAV